MRSVFVLSVLLLAGFSHALRAATAERFFFLNNGTVFQGCVYKPEGTGPFPVVIFNQNTVKPLPSDGPLNPLPLLGEFYTSRGYVLCCPGRHSSKTSGEGGSPEEEALRGHKRQAELVFSAIVALKAHSYVKPDRIFVTGLAAGATTSLLLSEMDIDVRGYVLFSPAAEAWKQSQVLRTALQSAVAKAKAPLYLIQPQNDLGLGPSEVLGRQLQAKGFPNRSKVFAPWGNNPKEANSFAIGAPDVWGADVLSFFADAAK